MGTAAVALIAFAIVFATAFTVFNDVISINASSSNSLRNSWKEAEQIVDSRITPLSASSSTTDIRAVITNDGRIKYAEPSFAEWEVVVRYGDSDGISRVEYLSYASTLATGTWTIQQIYLSEAALTTEVYEPGILNPGEEMTIAGRLTNIPGTFAINQVTITPPEGGGGSVHFGG